jgi:hypothetical protein
MTPNSNSSCSASADDTRELLGLIADDTRFQLRRWTAISVFLQCPLVLTPGYRRKATALTNEAVRVLRAMLACSKEAIRSLRKHRYDRCMRALDRFEHLRQALAIISQLTARAIVASLIEGRSNGRCR